MTPTDTILELFGTGAGGLTSVARPDDRREMSLMALLNHVRQRWGRIASPIAITALATAGLVAAPGSAATAPSRAAAAAVAPTPDRVGYDKQVIEEFDSANSMTHIRHLVENIGPRLNGTPQERQAAEYIGGVLTSYGFDVEYQTWGPVSTKRVAKVTSSDRTLPGGPNWQLSASMNGRFTGDAAPVTGRVVDVGAGTDPAAFAGASGAVVLANYSGTAATRNTVAANAVAAGATALIFAQTSNNAAPPTISLTVAQPSIPVLGGGTAHGTWLRGLLATGPVSLTIASNEYVTPMGTNVIAKRHAVDDPDGSKAPIVMVGAHIDSVLGAPGAHDDASGNGVSLEFARVISQFPLDKEIRIGGFGGEEGGLLGARAYVKTLTDAEKARFVGEWQMDMVGTPYEPARLWALTPNGQSNFVVEAAYDAVARAGLPDGSLQNCRLGQSDHQAFYDVGIPAALFIWLDYRKPASGICGSSGGTYVTEPQYHRPTDTMDNVSPERLQITLDVIGGSAGYNAFNAISIKAVDAAGQPLGNVPVRMDCGDGWRSVGRTASDGSLEAVAPHATCILEATSGAALVRSTVEVHGDVSVTLKVALPDCTTTITGTHRGALRVNSGVVCLDGARVNGLVTVAPGASLVSLDSRIGGAVTATGAADVIVCDSTISGQVRISSSERVRFGGTDGCGGSQISGGVTIRGTDPMLIVTDATVSGPMSILASAGPLPALLSGNRVSGKLQCSDNQPAPTNGGVPNIAGSKLGQCATL